MRIFVFMQTYTFSTMDTETNKDAHSPTPDVHRYGTRMFLFALELIPIFGIPAIIGVFLSKWVRATYPGTGTGTTVAILFVLYTLSWIVVFLRFRSLRKGRTS